MCNTWYSSSASLYLVYISLLPWKQHFPKRRWRNIFWKTILQQVHTPSKRACRGWSDHRHLGPNLMRLESSLKWPGYYNSWNTQVIRAEIAQKKWRPNPPTTKVYKKSLFIYFLLSLTRRNQSSDFQKQWRLQPDFCHLSALRSSDNSVTEMTHWRTSQWADPTDLTQRVLTRTWPSLKTKSMNNLMVCVEDNWMYMLCRANATLRQRL